MISVCFIIKNALINGYPFWESLESCLPIADEIVISEGNSDDKTMSYLEKFSERHPGIVKMFHDDWNSVNSPNGEVIAEISNRNLRRCQHNWIYYLQADEIIHPKNYSFIRMISSSILPVRTVEFGFVHFLESWEPIMPQNPLNRPGFYNVAIRMVKNDPKIFLRGDGWTFGGETNPMTLAEWAPQYLYHLGWVFPKNIALKTIEMIKIRTTDNEWKKKAEEAKKNLVSGQFPQVKQFDLSKFDLPPQIKRLVGMNEYLPPKEITSLCCKEAYDFSRRRNYNHLK